MKLITKTKEENNANGKNEYQFNMGSLEEIVSKLNDMKRRERKEYINQIFVIPTEEKNKEQVEPDNEVQEEISILTLAEIEREQNIKANEALDKLQRQEAAELMAQIKQKENGKWNPDISSNKAIGTTAIQKLTSTAIEEIKIGPSENIEVEEQSISDSNIEEYEKDNVQLCLMNLFNNNEHCPFSEKFKSDKIYTKIMDNFGGKNYHSFIMNAFSENGFYTSSHEYLTKFCEKDRNILSEFIKMYIKNVNEMETENNINHVT